MYLEKTPSLHNKYFTYATMPGHFDRFFSVNYEYEVENFPSRRIFSINEFKVKKPRFWQFLT